METSPVSILSMAEAKGALRLPPESTARDNDILRLCLTATALMEAERDAPILERHEDDGEPIPYTELHDLDQPQPFIYVRVRPIVEIISMTVGVLGGTGLQNGQDLIVSDLVVDPLAGCIKQRLAGRGLASPPPISPLGPDFDEDWSHRFAGQRFGSFPGGTGCVRVIYRGGYTKLPLPTTGKFIEIDGILKHIASQLLQRLDSIESDKSGGKVTATSTIGSASKFSDGVWNDELRAMMWDYRNLSHTGRKSFA